MGLKRYDSSKKSQFQAAMDHPRSDHLEPAALLIEACRRDKLIRLSVGPFENVMTPEEAIELGEALVAAAKDVAGEKP